MKRPKRTAPDGTELRPASVGESPTQPSALSIASETIEKLEAEIAALKASGAHFAPQPIERGSFESRVFEELVTTTRHMRRYEKDLMRFKRKWHDAEQRNRLLEDRVMSLQLVAAKAAQ
jgi:hypothetical protein